MGNIKGSPVMVKNLNWFFGEKEILHNVSLELERGKFYSIIGPNGSGKTTLLKNMSKLLETEENSVFIENSDITKLKNREIAKRIACVPQNTNIDFNFSVLDVVLMGRSPYLRRFQSESETDVNIVKKAMLSTNTWHLREKGINEISGGERQRVIVARALAQETNIMLLDEPVSQLDIHHQVDLMDTIRSLIDTCGLTVVAVLHDLNIAAQYSDYLILLNGGRIVSQGSPQHVLTEDNLEKVYNLKVYIMNNPVTNKPHIIPVGINVAENRKVI